MKMANNKHRGDPNCAAKLGRAFLVCILAAVPLLASGDNMFETSADNLQRNIMTVKEGVVDSVPSASVSEAAPNLPSATLANTAETAIAKADELNRVQQGLIDNLTSRVKALESAPKSSGGFECPYGEELKTDAGGGLYCYSDPV